MRKNFTRAACAKALAITALIAALVFCTAIAPATAAARRDPDWPCQQIKVPTISAAAVWAGPTLEGLKPWREDQEVSDLVERLAARRTSLEDAQKLIDAFSNKPEADKRARLTLVFAGVFEELNKQREEVIGGLARVAHRQEQSADQIRAENHDFLELRDKAGSDPNKLKELSDKLDWDTRIFEDRNRSISFACEVPVLIEQRVFAIGRMIEAKLD
ncbi:MAG: hypothetical protein JOZ30_12730 [Hyphomicrobiales bacterium]|nr:hypothetical protein [Hyphomicrobiales bacterium]